MYEQRIYREWVSEQGLVSFQVIDKESDLFIRAEKNLRVEAEGLVRKYRRQIEDYTHQDDKFLTSLKPYKLAGPAPAIVLEMAAAARKADVGPMAAVAGVIAEYVGRELLTLSGEVMVENGGDIYIKSRRERILGIYAGNSSYTGKIALQIKPEDTPLVVATSSGSIGHSLSFGGADAATVISKSGALSDACATRLGNLVSCPEDINGALDTVKGICGVQGAVVIMGETIGVWGKAKLSKM